MGALTAPQLAYLRNTAHATKLALVVYNPSSVLTCQVNGAQATGARTITVDNVGVLGTANKHYQVLFGSAAGLRDLGEARFISYTSGTLVVSAHNAALADNTHITVKEEIKPQSIHVAIDDNDVVSEDGTEAYGSSYNSQYIPLARCGTHAVAYIDPATSKATVNFYQRSTAIADGATIASHLWTWAGGTVVTGSTTTAGTSGSPNVVTWDTAGDYYCSYRVTDSNGKTHTRYFVVFVRDYNAENVYTNLEISGMEGDASTGVYRATLNIATSAGATAFPSRALCVLFAEDWFGATKTSIGSLNDVHRENIVMVGYIRRGTTQANWAKSSVSFEIESISGVMENAWALAGGVETSSAPAGWHQLYNMNFNTAVHHVITRHATVSQITDCYLNLPSYTIEYLDLPDASLAESLRNMIAPVRGRMGCNAQGHLYFEANPQLVSLASRSTTYTIQTTNADMRDEIDFSDEGQEKQVSQVDFAGEDVNADPVFSLAPANPWTTGRSEKLDAIRVDSQTQSNEFSGLYEGYFNNPFSDVTINWRGNYRALDIFPAEPIAVNISATQNARGIAWSTQRCWIKRVSYEYSGTNLRVTTVVEKDSYGAPGITGEYPVTIPNPTPVDPPPYWDPPPVDPPPPRPGGKGDLLYLCATNAGGAGTGGIAVCVGAYSGTPTWSVLAGGPSNINGLSGTAKSVRAINFDPFSYTTQFTAMWALTDAGLYLGTGLDGTPSFSKKLDDAAATALLGVNATLLKSFTPNVRVQNQILILARGDYGVTANRYRIYTLWSNDNGATWNGNASYYLLVTDPDKLQIIASYHTSGVYWIVGDAYGTQSATGEGIVYKATTLPQFVKHFGFNQTGVPFYGGYATLTFPFINASGTVYANDNVAYMYGNQWSDGTAILRRFDTLETAATPTPTPTSIGDARMIWGASTPSPYYFYPSTFNSGIIIGARKDGSVSPSALDEIWTTINGGASWELKRPQTATRTNLNAPRFVYMALADENILYISGHDSSGNIYVNKSTDFGTTFTGVDNFGTANAVDTVLGTGNYAGEILLLDYIKE